MPDIPDGLFPGLLIIPMLAIIILAHEFGHFFAARSVGIKVEEFGIGIPPRAKGWRWKNVLWSLNWIPLGGFVRVKGEDGQDFDPGSMNAKGPLARGFFLIAGSSANLLAAVVISIVLVASQGVPTDTTRIYINQVEPDSPAAEAGWQPGDAIFAVDGEDIDGRANLTAALDASAGSETPITVLRGGEQVETSITPRENPPVGQGATGVLIIEAYLSDISVGSVEPASPAADAGWLSGDDIIAVNGEQIESVAQASSMLDAAAGGAVDVTVERNGEQVATTLELRGATIELTEVAQDSPASDALLYAGDRIRSIDGTPLTDADSLLTSLQEASGAEVPVVVEREGREIEVSLTVPKIGEEENPLALIGANAFLEPWQQLAGAETRSNRAFDSVPVGEVIPEGLDQFWFLLTGTLEGLRETFTSAPDPDDFAGPVGMGQLTSEVITESSLPVWFWIGNILMVISVGLGLLNLLPIPALDGGRLVFVIVEILRGGKRVPPEKEGLIHLAGLALLLALMFFVAFNDVGRIIDGDSILP
ncbi:MAG: site-2 protease family protein [Thermomicrobiales bacterium]